MIDLEQQLARQPFRPAPEEWREQILRATARAAAPPVLEIESAWWRKLLWPSPNAWMGVAAVWMIIALGHLTMPQFESASGPPPPIAARSAEAWSEQQRLLADLFPAPPAAEPPPKAVVPRRRSQRALDLHLA